ncbi:hypothetical protein PS862_02829 [Pseudomonas fluorescens]|uniref:Uncharacterized protein n=1 Tax=Pseudomonas fluorescens TaxID=294 RepID=A0A5E7KFY1_PSEFL|nr:hypothetical protein [Pseudomonas fluorescens]VVP00690.1 hypothetical protein PS862_02829 [Pseudomonas fluorescens]
MKELVQQKDLQAYLKGLAAASMLVVSISTPVFEIASTVQSTFEMAHLAETRQEFFGDGPYMIQSKDSDGWKERSWPDPSIARYAAVFTIQVKLARRAILIGGYDALMSALKDYEYLEQSTPKTNGGIGRLLVKQPSDPVELMRLRDILLRYSIRFVIDDGSGFIHPGNHFSGNGLHSEISADFQKKRRP